jgi:tricorn protease
MRLARIAATLFVFVSIASAQNNRGYYRFPAIHDDTIVFTSEGDLWTVGVQGGVARRLTTHPGEETHPAFSPDGKTIAFSANYEGPTEIYTIPATGGLPVRRTFENNATVVGWTPDGKILYSTRRYSTLPDSQLATIDADNRIELVPLSQASQGSFDKNGTLFFTRLDFQGSYSKRYQGGTAQNLWKYAAGKEAVPLTGDFNGTSKNAMCWNGRVYFLSDRDGTMNLWSISENGKDLKQHTKNQGWDAKDASLSNGRVVYQMGADLHVYDIAAGTDKAVPIELASDFDNLREHWIKSPIEYLTSAHVSPDGSHVALISRGRAFVAPVKQGRFVEIASLRPGRFREARYMKDGKSLLLLATESGEVELWRAPANGVGAAEQLTKDGKTLRWEAIPSPDGKWIAHQDKDNQLWLFDTATKLDKLVGKAEGTFNSGPLWDEVRWSPDSRWLLFDLEAANTLNQVMLYDVEKAKITPITTDRYENHGASWSADGKWIYFLSDRSLRTTVFSPWGSRQPDPYFDRTNKIYAIALQKGLRSPFEPTDELQSEKSDAKTDTKPSETKPDTKTETKTETKPDSKPDTAKDAASKDTPKDASKDSKSADKKDDKAVPKIEIDLDGITSRLYDVPVPAGNYWNLHTAGNRLCWMDRPSGENSRPILQCVDINNKGDKPETLMEDVRGFEISLDGKKMLIRKQSEMWVVDASAKAGPLKDSKTLADSAVDLSNWTFSIIPANEFKEEFADAWRLHRDYFYDRNMHGVNWKAMRDKYGEILNRVRDREELSDLLAGMVSELAALHTFVAGGDVRRGTDQIRLASLGARLVRDHAAGGYRVEHVYKSDPDRPDRKSPLARPGVDVGDGDVLLSINGRDVLSVADPGDLLRNQAGKQVLIRVKPKDKAEPRDLVVKPINLQVEQDLRYHEWEYTRRLKVEEASNGQIGYVHLRAMVANDINTWVEEYTPVYNRQGLIVDVRHNGGGNIDSWILGKLMRKAWMYWQSRSSKPYWNMQEAFRGYVVVLCDQWTGSDGEAFTEGFRRLGLGKVIGMRTWGGEIWLSASNVLADRGIATAAENGVYGPERKWLIEGHGVDPDIVVDNLPHATFEGKDAQLEAAIDHLQQLIKQKPIEVPLAPDYPIKTLESSGAASGKRTTRE